LRLPSLESDAAAHLALFSDPATARHRPDPAPLGPEASIAKLARDIEHWRIHGLGRWTAERADSVIVSFGGVTMPEHDHGFADAVNLSYHLLPSHWGQRYATELADATLRFAFEELKADHVIGLVRAWNPASVRVLERVGLTLRREIEFGGAPTLLHLVARRPA
jgi:RimJ/RimL family protein N-acetyltransferase